MHIDLNSCFATAEQQASPLLRGKPVVVAAYITDNGCVLSPSIEAKRYGIKTGMRVREAKELFPRVIILPPDPPKYRDIHQKFITLLQEYSPDVSPRSIDEAVVDFRAGKLRPYNTKLISIAQDIKHRIREEIGEWISCSIGISTNHFLAKLAAGLHKPDGLDVIDGHNAETIYQTLKLTDLPGINVRTQIRLNSHRIWTPLDLFHASARNLQYGVFQSIVGSYWYQRLRGWRIDADSIEWERKSFGHQYTLGKWTDDPKELASLLMKLTDKMGRRLRRSRSIARGIHVSCFYADRTSWGKSQTFERDMYTTHELYEGVQYVFQQQPALPCHPEFCSGSPGIPKQVRDDAEASVQHDGQKKVALLSVSCFQLSPIIPEQQELFDSGRQRWRTITDALDQVNDRFGEFTVTSARMMNMRDKILDRISFGRSAISH